MHWAAPISGSSSVPVATGARARTTARLNSTISSYVTDGRVVGPQLLAQVLAVVEGEDRERAARRRAGVEPAAGAERVGRRRTPARSRRPQPEDPAGVVAVDLAQDVVGQADAVDLPAALARARRRCRSRTTRRTSRGTGSGSRRRPGRAPCPRRTGSGRRSAGRTPGSCTAGGRARRAARRCRRRGSGCASSSRPTSAEVLRGAADVGADERRPRMARRRAARTPPAARRTAGSPGASGSSAGRVGQKCQSGWACSSSQRSFVGVERLEERDRVGDVDDDREVQLGGGRPERVEARVVDGDEAAVRVARPQPEQLPDLEPARAPRGRVAQPRRLGLAERRVGRPAVVVEPGEDGDPIRTRRPASARSRPRAPRPGRRRGRRSSRRRTRRASRSARPASGSPSRRRTATRGGCARRRPGTAAGRTSWAGTRSDDRGRKSASRRSSRRSSGSRMTTWPRWRGASGSQPRVRARLEGERMAGWRSSGRRADGCRPAADQAHLAGASLPPRSRRRRSATSSRPETRGLLDDARPPRRRPAPPTRPTTSIPGSQTEIGPWRNSSGS